MDLRKALLMPGAAAVGLLVTGDPARAQESGGDGAGEPWIAVDSLARGAGILLRVDGMSCPFCAYGLEQRFSDVAAVDTIVVRVSDGLVLIRTKPGHELSDETIAETVRRSGFSLREIQRREG